MGDDGFKDIAQCFYGVYIRATAVPIFENFSKNNHMTLKDVVAHLSVLLEEHGDYTFAVISKGQGLKLTGKKVGLEIDDENKVITLIDTGK